MSKPPAYNPHRDLTVNSLAEEIAAHLGWSHAEGRDAVDAFTYVVGRTIAAGYRVRLNNFGSFERQSRRVRAGLLRTPEGHEVELTPREVPTIKFTVRGHLRDVLRTGLKYRGIVRVVPPRAGRAGDAFLASGPGDDETAA
jgi:nucleoid DNA-binding protein